MTHWAVVLQIKPLLQARCVEEMITNGDFGGESQVVVTDGADVLVGFQLLLGGVDHRVDFDDRLTAFLVFLPTEARLFGGGVSGRRECWCE